MVWHLQLTSELSDNLVQNIKSLSPRQYFMYGRTSYEFCCFALEKLRADGKNQTTRSTHKHESMTYCSGFTYLHRFVVYQWRNFCKTLLAV